MTKEEADLITGELDLREKRDLDASYGVVERGRRPREYAPALGQLEKDQKTRAKRRHLDVVDRGLMDLVSVYRDAIALATGAAGQLVNEEVRADVEQLARISTPELNLRRIGWIFDAREQMLEFNVPVRLGAGVDDAGAEGAGRRWSVRRVVALVIVVALVLAGVGVAVLTLTGGDEQRRSSPEPTPTSASPDADRPPRAPPDRRRATSGASTTSGCGGSPVAATSTARRSPSRSTTTDPDGRTIDLALLSAPAADPRQRVGSLVVNPGGPGAPGTSYAAQSGLVFRDPLLDSFDIVGFDPRGTGASSPVDCLTDAQLDAYIAADPSPDTPAERRRFRRDVLGARRRLRREVR